MTTITGNFKGSVANYSSLPAASAGDVYVTIDTQKLWQWSGSAWVDNGIAPLIWINLSGNMYLFNDGLTPSKYESTTATVVDNARNTAGYVIGAVIREDVAKAAMSWNYMPIEEWANILKKFSGTHGGNFTASISLFLQDTATWETRTMYVSDRKADMFIRDHNGLLQGYQDCSFSLVEV